AGQSLAAGARQHGHGRWLHHQAALRHQPAIRRDRAADRLFRRQAERRLVAAAADGQRAGRGVRVLRLLELLRRAERPSARGRWPRDGRGVAAWQADTLRLPEEAGRDRGQHGQQRPGPHRQDPAVLRRGSDHPGERGLAPLPARQRHPAMAAHGRQAVRRGGRHPGWAGLSWRRRGLLARSEARADDGEL
ncbi:MAG: hypothetical protein AVDCRST_MAG27-2861, partial [uncultured Craurococcus sp.]